ncbi:MAG: DUF61 family protein [Euryarchaeota archaeon]|nr:DUF61 family protein [Euryarchaeota archaeon]
MDDRFVTYVGHELAHLNDHLPKKRAPLKTLVEQDEPGVPTKTGKHYFEKRDMKFLRNFVPKMFWEKISLPLVLLRRRDTYTFEGDIYECFLIRRILDDKEYTSDVLIETETTITLYTPQVIELKKRFKSLFVIGFGM